MTALRIVSLNAWGGQCWDALSRWLPSLDVDVLCLQEVIRAPVPSPAWLHYRDANRQLQQRADLFGDVCRMLPDHQAQFAAAARGPLVDDAGTTYLSEHGIAQWVAPHLARVAHWQGFVHGSFRHDGWGPEPVPRAAQVLRVSTGAGKSLVVAHLHGLREESGKGDTPARSAQWRAMSRAISNLRAPGDPVILAGDLNILPNSEAFTIFAEIGLRDLISEYEISDTRTSLYPKPQRFADYLLVSAGLTIHRFEVPAQPEVSDHRPLIIEISLA